MPQKIKSKKTKVRLSKKMSKLTIKPTAVQEQSVGRSLLQALGTIGGGAVGAFGGDFSGGVRAGRDIANRASTILGMGKYTVKKNVFANTTINDDGSIPYIHSTNQSTVVRHTEYIGDLVSAGTAQHFQISAAYPLNPGMNTTFPWLSSIANQFQEYSFRGLMFEYRSTSADAIASSTNTALGSVMLGTTYNPAASPFTSKVQMLNEYYSSDTKPSHNVCHLVECDPKENPFNVLYVRSGAVPPSGNIQNYDLGSFYAASAGFQGTNIVYGELWVSYEVELRKPTPAALVSSDTFVMVGTASSVGDYFGVTAFGSGAILSSSYQGGSITLGTNTITINSNYVGAFMVTFTIVGTLSGTVATPSLGTTASAVGYQIFDLVAGVPTQSNISNQGTTSTTLLSIWAFKYVPGQGIPGQIILTMSGGTIPGSSNQWNLQINPIASTVTVGP